MTGPKLTGSRCQCTVCGEVFGNVRGFDRHRIGTLGEPDRRCLTAADLLAAGWRRNPRGILLTPAAEHAPASIAGPSAPPPATTIARAYDEAA